MIIASRGRNVASMERRLFENASDIPVPGSPVLVGRDKAIGVAAVAAAVRLVSETTASMTMRTYRGDAQLRQPVLNAPQAELFQHPAEGWTSFDLWQDTVTALELYKNAFLWKVRTRRGVEEIWPLDPEYLMVETDRRTGTKRVNGWVDGRRMDITSRVIHIRGWSHRPGSLEGTATLDLHRDGLRSAYSYEEYRGRYFENDATPGIILEHPGNPTRDQRRDMLRGWVQRHQGPRNAGVPGMVWGGVKATSVAASMRDAQGAEIADSVIRDVALMFRIYPAQLLHLSLTTGGAIADVEAASDAFFRFSLMHRWRRIERALATDPELFPDRSLYPRFDASEFIRGDIATQAAKVHQLVQVGVETPNEGRAEMGFPPHPDGDKLQITPVGGAPNEGPGTPAVPDPDTEPAPV